MSGSGGEMDDGIRKALRRQIFISILGAYSLVTRCGGAPRRLGLGNGTTNKT